MSACELPYSDRIMTIDASQSTKQYRLFVTNGRGRIDTVAHEIQASSDEEAFAKARQRVGDAPFEVWDGSRRIATMGHGERDANRPGD